MARAYLTCLPCLPPSTQRISRELFFNRIDCTKKKKKKKKKKMMMMMMITKSMLNSIHPDSKAC